MSIIVTMQGYQMAKRHDGDLSKAMGLLSPSMRSRLAEWFTGDANGEFLPIHTSPTQFGDHHYLSVTVLHNGMLFFMRLWEVGEGIEISQDAVYRLEALEVIQEVQMRQAHDFPLVGERSMEFKR